jgi:uncharacterized protein YbjQ (UPF0145 family)
MTLFFLLLTGCATVGTEAGYAVRPITNEQKINAKYLGIVTGSFSFGWSTAEDADGALNEVRNKAAELGGNAIYIVSSDSDSFTTTVVAEVYFYDFNSKKDKEIEQ